MDSSPDPRHFVGRESYEQAVDELLPWAIHHICLFDQSLSARSDTARRIEALRARLRAGVKVRLLVHDGSRLERDCPRTLNLLKHFGHGLAIHRTPDEAAHLYDPFCHVDARGYARRYHFDDLRGVTCLEDLDTATDLARRFDEMWSLSTPALAATTLGL